MELSSQLLYAMFWIGAYLKYATGKAIPLISCEHVSEPTHDAGNRTITFEAKDINGTTLAFGNHTVETADNGDREYMHNCFDLKRICNLLANALSSANNATSDDSAVCITDASVDKNRLNFTSTVFGLNPSQCGTFGDDYNHAAKHCIQTQEFEQGAFTVMTITLMFLMTLYMICLGHGRELGLPCFVKRTPIQPRANIEMEILDDDNSDDQGRDLFPRV